MSTSDDDQKGYASLLNYPSVRENLPYILPTYAREKRSLLRLRSSPRQALKRRRDQAIGEAPDNARAVMLSLIADCDLRAYDSRRASRRWASSYYFLGLPAAVLATVAGAAGLASTAGRIPAAIIALAAAGLATAATFLNSNENKQQQNKLSAAWQELADDARLWLVQYGPSLTLGTALDPPFEIYDYMLRYVIYFSKRKSALLRGDFAPIPEPQLVAHPAHGDGQSSLPVSGLPEGTDG